MKKVVAGIILILCYTFSFAPPTMAEFVFTSDYEAAAAATPTAAPTKIEPTSSPTPAPTEKAPAIRYGKTMKSGVNIRASATAKAKIVSQIRDTGTHVIIHEETQNASNETWYYVEDDGAKGYVRSDLIALADAEMVAGATTADSESAKESLNVLSQEPTSKKSSGSPSSPAPTSNTGTHNSPTGGVSYPDSNDGATSGVVRSATASKSTQAPAPKESSTVWIPQTGLRYHSQSGCSGITATRVTLSQAQSMGYAPCNKCH